MNTERVKIGHETVDQVLIDGVTPVTETDRQRRALERRAASPIDGGLHPCDIGLFDEDGRKQGDLF